MVLLLLFMAFAIGLVIPLQSAVNNALRHTLASTSLLAALISFLVGTVALAAVSLVTGQPFASLAGLPRVAWWQWTGGVMGAISGCSWTAGGRVPTASGCSPSPGWRPGFRSPWTSRSWVSCPAG